MQTREVPVHHVASAKMADAEDDSGEPAPKRVHFGSLEEVERQRLLKESGENGAGSMSEEIKAGIEAGHINVSACKLIASTVHNWDGALGRQR